MLSLFAILTMQKSKLEGTLIKTLEIRERTIHRKKEKTMKETIENPKKRFIPRQQGSKEIKWSKKIFPRIFTSSQVSNRSCISCNGARVLKIRIPNLSTFDYIAKDRAYFPFPPNCHLIQNPLRKCSFFQAALLNNKTLSN